MSDREELDFKAIEAWALAHGFEKTGANFLSAPYGEGMVQIEFLTRSIRVSLLWGEHSERLITAYHKRLYIDDNDMLQGAGLFSRFYTKYRDDYSQRPDTAQMPVWFGAKVREMIADHIASDEKSDRLRARPV